MVKFFSRFMFSLFCPAGVFPGNGCLVRGWDARMSREENSDWGSLYSTGDRVREESESKLGFLLQSWGWYWGHWISGAVGEVWVGLEPICCPGRSGFWVRNSSNQKRKCSLPELLSLNTALWCPKSCHQVCCFWYWGSWILVVFWMSLSLYLWYVTFFTIRWLWGNEEENNCRW